MDKDNFNLEFFYQTIQYKYKVVVPYEKFLIWPRLCETQYVKGEG